MEVKERIVIVGGGGHSKVLIGLIKKLSRFEIVGILDPNLQLVVSVLGVNVIGSDELLEDLFNEGVQNACIAVGGLRNFVLRQELFEKCKKIGFNIPPLVDPSAIVDDSVILKEGVQIIAGCIVQPGTIIEENTIVNTGAIIEHDCFIGKNSFVGPKAVVAGRCIIGDNTFIGVGATIIDGIKIGRNVVVGAGAVVVKDVENGKIVKGVPAK